ncbi:Sulfurtransferase [Balamuthia mandrillaris]
MCMRSAIPLSSVTNQGGSSRAGVEAGVLHISQLRKNFDKYFLVDVREAAEHQEDHIEGTGANIGLGPLLRDAADGKLADWKNKKLVCYCNVGYRSGVAARELSGLGFDAVSLNGGLAAWKGYFYLLRFPFAIYSKLWHLFSLFFCVYLLLSAATDPAASSFDFVALLGRNMEGLEQVTMAFSLALVSQKTGKPSAVVLMMDGVEIAKRGLIQDSTHVGEPFKPLKPLLEGFLVEGGHIFACRTCVEMRKLKFGEDLEEWARPASAPDVLRWLTSAQSSVQLLA